jgi:hypothetical protein
VEGTLHAFPGLDPRWKRVVSPVNNSIQFFIYLRADSTAIGLLQSNNSVDLFRWSKMPLLLWNPITLLCLLKPATWPYPERISIISNALLLLFLLDALQLLVFFVGTLTYLEPKLSVLVVFYNYNLLISNY